MTRSPFLAWLVIASTAAAQSFVVPSRAATQAGNDYDVYLFHGTATQQPTHVQLLYNATDIALPAALLKGMNLRRSNAVAIANTTGIASLSVILSVGPFDASASTTTFATNHGAVTMNVFTGSLNLPAASNSGPGPAQFVVSIPFTMFFPYVAAIGKSLVVDVKTTSFVPGNGSSHWYVDEQVVDAGKRGENPGPQPSCKFSNGRYSSVISYAGPPLLIPGGRWFVQYQNLLPNAPGVAAMGNQGAGGRWGTINLPLDLGPLGAPSCGWSTSVLLLIGLLCDAGGNATWPTLQIANDPALVGATFFDHAAFLDAAANTLGIVTTWSSRWTIGSGTPPEGAKLYRTQDAGNPTGTKVREATVAEFVY